MKRSPDSDNDLLLIDADGKYIDDSNEESDFIQKNGGLFSAIEEASESGANNNQITSAAKESNSD